MKNLLYPFKVLYAWWYFFIFALIFLLLYPAFFILLSNEKWYATANRLRIAWARILFVLTGIIPKVYYKKKLNRKHTYIFCPNHFSYLDIPMTAFVVKRNWRFMAKSELGSIPLLNIFFKSLDILVDRDNARESFKSVKEASESIDKKFNIVIYPEGAIGAHQPHLLKFKNGPFKMAIEKQIPIVPVTFIDNWKILSVNGWKMFGQPGIARVIVHEPVETKGMNISHLEQLKEDVRNTIENELKKYL